MAATTPISLAMALQLSLAMPSDRTKENLLTAIENIPTDFDLGLKFFVTKDATGRITKVAPATTDQISTGLDIYDLKTLCTLQSNSAEILRRLSKKAALIILSYTSTSASHITAINACPYYQGDISMMPNSEISELKHTRNKILNSILVCGDPNRHLIFKALFQQSGVDPNEPVLDHREGNKIIELAAYSGGNDNVVREILASGKSTPENNGRGLFLAARNGKENTVKLFVEYAKKVPSALNLHFKNQIGTTPLGIAIQNDCTAVTRLLLGKNPEKFIEDDAGVLDTLSLGGATSNKSSKDSLIIEITKVSDNDIEQIEQQRNEGKKFFSHPLVSAALFLRYDVIPLLKPKISEIQSLLLVTATGAQNTKVKEKNGELEFGTLPSSGPEFESKKKKTIDVLLGVLLTDRDNLKKNLLDCANATTAPYLVEFALENKLYDTLPDLFVAAVDSKNNKLAYEILESKNFDPSQTIPSHEISAVEYLEVLIEISAGTDKKLRDSRKRLLEKTREKISGKTPTETTAIEDAEPAPISIKLENEKTSEQDKTNAIRAKLNSKLKDLENEFGKDATSFDLEKVQLAIGNASQEGTLYQSYNQSLDFLKKSLTEPGSLQQKAINFSEKFYRVCSVLVNQIKEKEKELSYSKHNAQRYFPGDAQKASTADKLIEAEVGRIKALLVELEALNSQQQKALLQSTKQLLSAPVLDVQTIHQIEEVLSSLSNSLPKYSKSKKAVESISKPNSPTHITSSAPIAPQLFHLTAENFTAENFLKTLEIANLTQYSDQELTNINLLLVSNSSEDLLDSMILKIENIFKGDIDDTLEVVRRINFITQDTGIADKKESLIQSLYNNVAEFEKDSDEYKTIHFISDFFRNGICQSKGEAVEALKGNTNPQAQDERFVDLVQDQRAVQVISDRLSLAIRQGDFLPLQGTASHGYQASNPHNKKDNQERIRDNCITDLNQLKEIFGKDFPNNFDSKVIDLIISITAKSFSFPKSKKSGGSHNFVVEVPKILPPKESHLSDSEKKKYIDSFAAIAEAMKSRQR